MKLFPARLFLGLFALVFTVSSLAFAAPAPAPKKPAGPPPKFTQVIQSVSADSITTSTGKKSATYKIEKITKITLNGATSTANDLKSGMRVEVVPTFDGKSASAIVASDPKATPVIAPKAISKGSSGK